MLTRDQLLDEYDIDHGILIQPLDLVAKFEELLAGHLTHVRVRFAVGQLRSREAHVAADHRADTFVRTRMPHGCR